VLTKQRIVLLVLLLFALPAVVTTALLTQNVKHDVHGGAQPGGIVRGTAVDDEEHAVAGLAVTAEAVNDEGDVAQLGTTQTDPKGAFLMTLPPITGHYELRFEGPLWQESRVAYGFLDANGRKQDAEPLQVRMQAGCSLDIDLVRTDGHPAGTGTFELQGAPSGGLFAGWTGARLSRRGSFENGTFSVSGLPPMHGRLLITMATGERIDSTLDLARGKNHHKVDL
jgi:hypothetical protein